jgi:hypothetical protein
VSGSTLRSLQPTLRMLKTVLGQSECSQTYNPEEIDGDSSAFCDANRASIQRFVEVRRETLFEEILQQ